MKLFNIVAPHVAIFGRKDFQQLMVIKNMAQEMNLPIDIIGAPTVRSGDGLALSSRNGYLSAAERSEATRLSHVLHEVARALRQGATDIPSLEANAMAALADKGWKPQYIAVRKALDLQPVTALQCAAAGPEGLVVLGAAYLGTTRLIDNLEVTAD
jgi:pantoate--beta-alanine ligase